MAKRISLANQKGGAGKSTTTTFFANGMHSLGYRVAVVDCDYQRSLVKLRQFELDNDPDIDESTLYPIMYCSPNKIRDLLDDEDDNFDYIFVDVPGNITEENLLGVFSGVDLITVVHDANVIGFLATDEFIDKLQTEVIDVIAQTEYDPPKIVNILTRYEERTKLHKSFMNTKDSYFKYPFFSKQLRWLECFKSITTIKPYENDKYDYEFDLLYKELIKLI